MLKLIEDEGASWDVPAEWRGEYYPSYISEGYVLTEIDPMVNKVIYNNTSGDILSFGEYSEDEEISLDSENATISYATVNGNNTLIIEKDDTTITWSNGEKYFIVRSKLSRNETLKISASVRRIS